MLTLTRPASHGLRWRFMLCAFILSAGAAVANQEVPALDIDQGRITVAGMSSGAHMAHQLHIAYSDVFSGAAIIAGGPFNCAGNSLLTAMNRCTENTDQPLPVAEIARGIRDAAGAGKVADTGNLADDRVWMFHGAQDSKVSSLVHNAAADLYADFIPANLIRRVDDIPAGHVFPARGQGQGCTEFVPPYVGDCDYDAAGELLGHLYGDLTAPTSPTETRLLEAALPGAEQAFLMDTAYLFVPAGCAGGKRSCALHLVLHGCAQSAAMVGTEFIRQSGYLPWAAANDIILAFPQVRKSLVAPLNPLACWDWWGYTDEDYPFRSGRQMKVLVDWIRGLSS